jgi:ribonuclease BN (tRNA processing enzyme)
VRLIVLGCSGSGPGPASPASGYLVEAGGTAVTLDLGNGTFGALQRHLDPWRLDAVLLSHLHADHCGDMSALVVHRLFHPFPPDGGREQTLPVHAPAAAPERLAGQWATSAAEREQTDLGTALEFSALVDGYAARVGEVGVRAGAVDHPVEAYALRLEHGGRSLVYSGDTGPCPGLVELARDADVLLCEATWPHVTPFWDEPPAGLHLSGRQAGEHATLAGVGTLLITHVASWFDADEVVAEAKAAFDGPVELVAPDCVYEV